MQSMRNFRGVNRMLKKILLLAAKTGSKTSTKAATNLFISGAVTGLIVSEKRQSMRQRKRR